MKVTMVGHACVLVEDGPIAILMDPWLKDAAFNESWSMLCQPALTPTTLQAVTHIWISHEHPDHLSLATLKAIPPERKSNITLLYQKHFSSRVLQVLQRSDSTKPQSCPFPVGFPSAMEYPLCAAQ